jgi:hypothetical protein
VISVREAIATLRLIAEDLDEDAPLEVLVQARSGELNTTEVSSIEIVDDHVIVLVEGGPRPRMSSRRPPTRAESADAIERLLGGA